MIAYKIVIGKNIIDQILKKPNIELGKYKNVYNESNNIKQVVFFLQIQRDQYIKVDKYWNNQCTQKTSGINKVYGLGLTVFCKSKQKQSKRTNPQH